MNSFTTNMAAMQDLAKRRATRASGSSLRRALVALLTAAALAGCNKVVLAEEHIPESPPDPSYRAVIANYFKTTFKNYSSYEAFEILSPRWVHSFQGWNWLTCVRFVDRDRRRTYVLVLNGTSIVDAHYAVQTDDCGAQTYSVFEQMGGGGLEPLH
jgi:hypothetical protein